MLAELGLAVSQIAHEIANPLDGVWACVQLLEQEMACEDASPYRMRGTLDSLNIEIGRLRNLLNELRELPRPLKLNLVPVALSPLVSETLDYAAPTILPSILIRKDLPQNLPPVLADADKLKQVILNLVKNAVEAMADGGTLTLRTYRTAKYVCFEIEDTGVGIPGRDQSFSPLCQFQIRWIGRRTLHRAPDYRRSSRHYRLHQRGRKRHDLQSLFALGWQRYSG